MKVLVNGQLIGRDEASIDLEDRGYQFGDGIYEVIRVYKGYCSACASMRSVFSEVRLK